MSQTPLHFLELGFDSSYCRTASYQSGNGALYAAVGGGTPSYNYVWTNLQNGAIVNNPLAGVNPGCYQIKVTDAAGDSLVDTVCVDSMNPIAIIEPDMSDVGTWQTWYTANAPATIDLHNVSMNTGYDLSMPWPDTMNFSWKLGTFEPWVDYTDYYANSGTTVTFNYGGFWSVCLAVENVNGCRDTTCAYFDIAGPLAVDVNATESSISLANKTVSLAITQEGIYYLQLYDLSGKLAFEGSVKNNESMQLHLQGGIYIFQLFNQNMQLIDTGKLNYQP